MTTEIKDKFTGKTIITLEPIDPELIPPPRGGVPKWKNVIKDFLDSGESGAEITGDESALVTTVGLRQAAYAQEVQNKVRVLRRKDRVFLVMREES